MNMGHRNLWFLKEKLLELKVLGTFVQNMAIENLLVPN